MTMNSSGPISLGGATSGQSINIELGQSATTQVSLNDTNVRTLAGVSSGAITMPTNFYGKSTSASSGMLWVGSANVLNSEGLNYFDGVYVVPAGVTSISAVCIGAGGTLVAPYNIPSGGGLAYATFAVTPGETLNVTVSNFANSGSPGYSSIARGGTYLVGAYGANINGTAGYAFAGTGFTGGTGGTTGLTLGGGGGAAGYSGNGGAGGNGTSSNPGNGDPGLAGSGGGGGGGGGAGIDSGGSQGLVGHGGGTGPFGAGVSGAGGVGGSPNGGDGVDGSNGYAGKFGSGDANAAIGTGVVRIITQGGSYPSGLNSLQSNDVVLTTIGAGTWTVPAGVTSISVCCMAGGGGGRRSDTASNGGGGGGMRWYNNLSVTPGQSISYSIAAGGSGGGSPTKGDFTWFNGALYTTASVYAEGGSAGTTSTTSGGGGGGGGSTIGGSIGGYDGGKGGNCSSTNSGGGGGAAGLFGNGGQGANASGSPFSSTGGGGGGGYYSSATGSGGGGTGPYPGKNGFAASSSSYGGTGGGMYLTGGSPAAQLEANYDILRGSGGAAGGHGGWGGGGGAGNDTASGGAGNGGQGWIRIIWPGTDRTFPSKCGI